MSQGRFSDKIIKDWIDEIMALSAADTLYVGLWAGNPFTGGIEIVDPDYHRVQLALNRDADNLASNAERLVWENLAPGVHIEWLVAIKDDTSADHDDWVAAAPLEVAVNLPVGGTFPINAGDFVLGLDVATG